MGLCHGAPQPPHADAAQPPHAGAARGSMPAGAAPGHAPRHRLSGFLGHARLALIFCAKGILYAHLVFIASTSLLILCYAKVDPPATTLMFYRARVNHYTVRHPRPLSYAQVGKRRAKMLMRVEDNNFFSHHGFEPAAIKYALKINKRLGRPQYGASTLSMQTARSLFLIPAKSYFRKYLEAMITVELELLLSKRRILELYFGYAEWGKGIFGLEAASRVYYGRGQSAISDEEYLRLVALLSSPIRHTPSNLTKHPLLRWRYNYLCGLYLAPTPSPQSAKEGPEALPPKEGSAAPKAEEVMGLKADVDARPDPQPEKIDGQGAALGEEKIRPAPGPGSDGEALSPPGGE